MKKYSLSLRRAAVNDLAETEVIDSKVIVIAVDDARRHSGRWKQRTE